MQTAPDLFLPPMWPIQEAGVAGVLAAIEARESPICLTAPTGSGKTRMIAEIIFRFVSQCKRVLLYCNRRMLIDQMSKGMKALGLEHGLRVADKPTRSDALLQIASVQTDDSRSVKMPAKLKALELSFENGEIETGAYLEEKFKLQRQSRDLFEADLVVFDEGHLMTGPRTRAIITHYVMNEAAVVLVTATPVGLGFCKKLVVAGTIADCRACGALVWARHHGCTEPDLKKLKLDTKDEISEQEARKAIMTAGIFGYVLEHYKALNPDQAPSLLFAAGVRESIWFAEEFTKAGIRAAHIDGEDIWLDGEFEPSNEDARDNIIRLCRAGDVKVICNRFVLREGIDLPFIRHGILATLFGSLPAYLQACGRLLRADKDEETVERFGPKEFATIQDHGGHYWRLGSVNMSRDWNLGLPAHAYVGAWQESIRKKPELAPKTCEKCGLVMIRGNCPVCGRPVKTSRAVVQQDGTLEVHEEALFAPRKEKCFPSTQRLWDKTYWGAFKGPKGMTFQQAIGWFCTKMHYYPPRTLKRMPLRDVDFYRRVRSVPPEDLRQ